MRYRGWILCAALAGVVGAADWPMPGGNPQRNAWVSSERQITKANVRALKLLYKYQTDNESRGSNSLTTPIINGNLITYRGFKEMLLFGGSADKVFSVDADLNQLIWEANLPFAAPKPAAKPSTGSCPGGLTSPVIMSGSSSNSLHFAALASRAPAATGVTATATGITPAATGITPAATGVTPAATGTAPAVPTIAPVHPNPYLPPLSQSVYPLLPTTLTELDAVYTVSSDGYLHILGNATGQDLIPSVRFVPPNAKITSLNLRRNVVYATTADNCDGYQNALFALDILSPQKTVTSFIPPQGGFAGTAGTSIGNDGTIYVQVAYPKANDPRRLYETVVALTPQLKVKDYFTIGERPLKSGTGASGVTPMVFSFTARDIVVAGGRDGKIYLLDSRSLGGPDHHTPLFATPELLKHSGKTAQQNGFRGGFSTWFDADTGTRRVYVPVAGPLVKAGGFSVDGRADAGAVLAFEVSGTSERPTFEPKWVSGDLLSPAPAVIANGMVFVLSTAGTQSSQGASLHVLDAITGKDLHSNPLAASIEPANGFALANGRIYFTGRDNAVYCYGIPAQHTQLIKQ